MKAALVLFVAAVVALASAFLLERGSWWARPAPHPETQAFQTREPGIPLTAGLVSQASEAEVRQTIEGLQVALSVERPATPAHPPRHLLTLSAEPFEHLGVAGRLTLDFFNDRLMEVTFVPTDLSAYAEALRRAEPGLRRDRVGRQEAVDGPRRVVSNVAQLTTPAGAALGGTPFTLWQDRRLRAQLDDWDARFGHIPPPARPD